LLLCASSPKIKYAQREWVSHVPESFNLLKEEATAKKIKKYYDNTADANEYISQQNRKYFLANQYSMLKLEDIEVLNKVVTDDEIKSYKQDSGF
jgi:hypothetical protein